MPDICLFIIDPINDSVVNFVIDLHAPREEDAIVEHIRIISKVSERPGLPPLEIMQIADSVYEVWKKNLLYTEPFKG